MDRSKPWIDEDMRIYFGEEEEEMCLDSLLEMLTHLNAKHRKSVMEVTLPTTDDQIKEMVVSIYEPIDGDPLSPSEVIVAVYQLNRHGYDKWELTEN